MPWKQNATLQKQGEKQNPLSADKGAKDPGYLVGKHTTTRRSVWQRAVGKGEGRAHEAIIAESARTSWTIFHLGRMLTKREGLGAVELGTLFNFSKSTLTSKFVLFSVHLDIVLGVASNAVFRKEGTVATIQDEHIRVREVRVAINVDSAVMVPNVLGHNGSPVRRILAVKNQGSTRFGSVKQLASKSILVIIVESTVDVTTFIFIFESAVNNHNVIELTIKLPIQELQKGVLVDSR